MHRDEKAVPFFLQAADAAYRAGTDVGLVFITAFILWFSGRVMNDYTSNYFQALMDVENETVEKKLYGVEVAVANSIDDIEECLDSPASVSIALRTMQRRIMDVVGMTPADYRALFIRDL